MSNTNDGHLDGIARTDVVAHTDGIAHLRQLEPTETRSTRKKAVLLRLDPAMILRFDRVAKRLGISRAAFIVSSAVKELERIEKLG